MFAVGHRVHVADSKRVSYSQWRAERPQCDVIADPGIRRRGWREEGVELLVLFEALQVAATQTRRTRDAAATQTRRARDPAATQTRRARDPAAIHSAHTALIQR